jgi:hypothetical protein
MLASFMKLDKIKKAKRTHPSPNLPEIIERALAASKGTSLPKGMTIKDMINAGRKR